MENIQKNNHGFALIEIMLVLSMIIILFAGVGAAFSLFDRLATAGRSKLIANNYAQSALEVVVDEKDGFFACTCATDLCSANICTRSADGQSCTLSLGYQSCWTEYPKDAVGETEFYLDDSGGNWSLMPLGPSAFEEISGDSSYTRKIVIENVKRDVSGNIDPSGTWDFGTKNIIVSVWHEDRGIVSESSLRVMLTAWKDI